MSHNFLLILVLTLLQAFSGCVVVRERNTAWHETKTSCSNSADFDDANLYKWVNSYETVDTGRRASYGILPGGARVLFDEYKIGHSKKRKKGVGDYLGESISWPFAVGWCNAFGFGCPTLLSVVNLFSSPYASRVKDDYLVALGVVGKCAYEIDHTVITHKTQEEYPIYPNGNRHQETSGLVGETGSGKRLFFAYPGIDVINDEVRTNGTVAVVDWKRDARLVVFKESRYKKDALSWEEMPRLSDPVANRQIEYQLQLRELKQAVDIVARMNGVDDITEDTRQALSNLVAAVKAEMNCLLPSDDNAIENIKAGCKQVEAQIKVDHKTAEEQRKAEAERRRKKSEAEERARLEAERRAAAERAEKEAREIAEADNNAVVLDDGRKMSMHPKSKWYRGPQGRGMTNGEYQEMWGRQKTKMIEKARANLDKRAEFSRKGWVLYPMYSNGKLFAISVFDGFQEGEMRAGLRKEAFRYPSWMSRDDAELIWETFSVDAEQMLKTWQNMDITRRRLWDDKGNSVKMDARQY